MEVTSVKISIFSQDTLVNFADISSASLVGVTSKAEPEKGKDANFDWFTVIGAPTFPVSSPVSVMGMRRRLMASFWPVASLFWFWWVNMAFELHVMKITLPQDQIYMKYCIFLFLYLIG